MSDAAVVGLVVGVTGIVVSGILGPGATARWARRRQVADHQHEIRADHREVIDDAARYLTRARRLNEQIYEAWAEGTTIDEPPAEEAHQALKAVVEEIRYREAQLALRLGQEHPVCKAYIGTTLVLTDQFNPILDAFAGGQSYAANREKALDAIDAFSAEQGKFIDAAKDYLNQ